MPEPSARRRGVVLIDEIELARSLRLPEGQRILGFQPDHLRASIAVLVEGDGLPECAPGTEPPRINAADPWYSPAPTPDLTAGQRHQAVLDALAHPYRLEREAVRAGRRRVLERHAPYYTAADTAWCSYCAADATGPGGWPCDDYRDAAGDLAAMLAAPGATTSAAPLVSGRADA